MTQNLYYSVWGLARIHPVRTYLALLGKKVRTGSIKTITWTVHIECRSPATVSKNFPYQDVEAGEILISHLGNSGWRSNRFSTACIAALPSTMPLA